MCHKINSLDIFHFERRHIGFYSEYLSNRRIPFDISASDTEI